MNLSNSIRLCRQITTLTKQQITKQINPIHSQIKQEGKMPKSFKEVIEEQTKKLQVHSPEELRYSDERLKTIEMILSSMKKLNQNFLSKYELTENWHKINSGLMGNGHTVSLPNLIEFKICEANKWENSYFNPFVKKPITMCYNKFADEKSFNEALDYNLILYYDGKTKKNINWNILEDTTLATVRALHLANICQRRDQVCFHREIQKRVFDKERFKGKILLTFDKILKKGTQDTTPITQVRLFDTSVDKQAI